MSTRAAALLTLLVLVVVGAAGGCTSSAGGSPAHAATSDAPSAHKAATTGSPTPMLTPTAPAGTPLGAGERAWAAFTERGVPYATWWARLKPLLSDSAQAVYVYDDPRNLPVMKLTGQPSLAPKAPDQPKFTAEVVVPTSKGVFRLDLERHTVGSAWLLYAIRFPAGVS